MLKALLLAVTIGVLVWLGLLEDKKAESSAELFDQLKSWSSELSSQGLSRANELLDSAGEAINTVVNRTDSDSSIADDDSAEVTEQTQATSTGDNAALVDSSQADSSAAEPTAADEGTTASDDTTGTNVAISSETAADTADAATDSANTDTAATNVDTANANTDTAAAIVDTANANTDTAAANVDTANANTGTAANTSEDATESASSDSSAQIDNNPATEASEPLSLSGLSRKIGSVIGTTTSLLSGVSDADSASAALPALTSANDSLNQVAQSIPAIPDVAKAPLSNLISSGIDRIKPLVEQANSNPGVGEVLQPVLGSMLETLEGLVQ